MNKRTTDDIERLIAARRIDEATAAWQVLRASQPLDWRTLHDLGRLGLALRRPDAADCLRAAAERGGAAAPLVLLARHLLMTGDTAGALRAARAAMSRRMDDAVGLSQLATVLAHGDAGEEALALFDRAAALAPANATIQFNRATAQRANGLIAEAEATADIVIRLRPSDGEAYHFRAGLRRQTVARNHVAELGEAIRARMAIAGPKDAPLHFALGKELEDLGRYDEAFAAFAEGNWLRRQAFRYDVQGDIDTIEALIARHDTPPPASPRTGRIGRAPTPVFIVGLPRSGTTLVERILASHPDVTAAGELDAFPRAAVAQVGRTVNRDAFVTRSLAIPPDALGRAYLDLVGDRAGTTARFTDKLPLNALYLGLIGRALPAARIVLLRRDAMANGFAMFSTLFGDAYPFSYSLDEIGRYMAAWQRLMTHWQALLGDRVLTIRYEELVADPEAGIRALLAHCDLGWDPACLAFHEARGSVSTASAVQVRQPIYRDSVAKWRRYGTSLDPLRNALGDHPTTRSHGTDGG